MIDTLPYAALIGALGACLAAGCSAPAEKPQPSAQGGTVASSALTVQSPVSINAEMVRVVDHAAHQLWNTEKEGMAPKTEADWENIVEHATQIAAAGALIRLEGTGPNDRTFVQQSDWQNFGAAVSNAGLAVLRAAEAKNQPALVAANGQLVEACEGCHNRFKPALPSEGPYTHDVKELETALTADAAEGQTALYDGVAAGLLHVRLGHAERHALIVVSDGGDNVSRRRYAEILALARRSDAVIYAIGLQGTSPAEEEEDAGLLKRLCKDTGGIAYFPRTSDEIAAMASLVARDLHADRLRFCA